MHESGPGYVERTLGGQQSQIECVDRAGGIAEAGEKPARPETIERAQESVLADPVIDDRNTFAAGDVLDAGDEIFSPIIDDMGAAMGTGELGFFIGADGADQGDAEMFCPLAGNQADAAGGGVK